MKIFKILIRLIVLPFVAAIVFIALMRFFFSSLWMWINYGGELMMYENKFNPLTFKEQLKEMMRS